MSHVAAIDLFVTDLDALERACKQLGLVLKRGQKTYTWYGVWMDDFNEERAAAMKAYDPKEFGKCAHAIQREGHRPGDYEIGLVKNPNGDGWSTVFDDYGSGHYFAAKLGGGDLPELKSEYAAAVTEADLWSQGYLTEREYLPNNEINVLGTMR